MSLVPELASDKDDIPIASAAANSLYHRPGGSRATLWELQSGFRCELAFARLIGQSALTSCRQQLQRVAALNTRNDDYVYDMSIGNYNIDVKSCSDTIKQPAIMFAKDSDVDISRVIYVLLQPIPGQNPFLPDPYYSTFIGWCPGFKLKHPPASRIEALNIVRSKRGYYCSYDDMLYHGLVERLRASC